MTVMYIVLFKGAL